MNSVSASFYAFQKGLKRRIAISQIKRNQFVKMRVLRIYGFGLAGLSITPRASCFWVYAYPAFLMYAAHSAGGYWARILPQASEIAS